MNTEENNNNNFSSTGSSFWEKMVSFWHNNRDFGQPEPGWINKADLINGTVPASQLPSYVDDVVESDTYQTLPASGEKGKIYIVTSNNTQYRWSGSGYIEINSESEITNHLKNYWKINSDSGYKGINADKPFAILNNSAAQNVFSGGVLASNAYSDSRFIPENGIHAKGFIQSDEGFQNRYYKVGQRNRIWSFANADAWGMSYYQGAGLSPFLGEGIGFHFGDATDYKVYIHESGKLYTKDNVVIDGNVAWHAGNLNPDNYIKNGGAGTAGNPVWLGWTNSNLQLQVDNQVIGNIWHSGNFNPSNYVDKTSSQYDISGHKQFTNSLSVTPGKNIFLKGYSDVAHFIKNFSDDYDGFGVSTGFAVKAYNDENFNIFTAGGNGSTWTREESSANWFKSRSGTFIGNLLRTEQGYSLIQLAGAVYVGDNQHNTYLQTAGGLYHSRAGIGSYVIWDGYNFNPETKADLTYLDNTFAQKWENARAIGFNQGDANSAPYIYHDTGGYRYLATQSWVDSNFVNSVENAIELGFEYAVNQGRPYVRHSDGTIVFLERDLPVSGAWTNHKALSDRKVIGEMAWKNYGNGHTIFDISSGNTPWGVSKSNVDAEIPWSPTYPTLVGGNGSNTYGVRVDSARVADKVNGYELSDFVRMDVPQTISSRKIMNGGTGNSYTDAALEIQGNGSTVIPGISFHQPGVVASQIRMDPNGQICIVDNPGSNFENFRAKTITGQNFTSVEHGNSSQWNQAYNWGNHSAQGYATQSWVQSQNYASTDSVNEATEKITEEHTNPEYPVTPYKKFTVIIITEEFTEEFLNIGELIRERKIEVINTSSREILVNCEVGTVDSIRPSETTEYYISSNNSLIKKGSYRDASILT